MADPSQTIAIAMLGGCPRIGNLLRKSHFGQIPRSFSLNGGAIRLKRSKNPTQNGFYPRAPSLDAAHQFTLPSLRFLFSDSLLAFLPFRTVSYYSGVHCNIERCFQRSFLFALFER
jgi:hypothetical protein